MIGVWRLYEAGKHSTRVVPRGLAPDRRYRITYDNSETSVTANGMALVNDGITVCVSGNLCSELLLIEEV